MGLKKKKKEEQHFLGGEIGFVMEMFTMRHPIFLLSNQQSSSTRRG